MSVLDIMNYVKSTPGNTNPAVIRSLVEGEQRSAVHEEVDSLKEKSVIGDVEWVPYAEVVKEHYGLEKENLYLELHAVSVVKPLEEGEVLKVKTVHGVTEGKVFVMEEDGYRYLVVSNFMTKDNFLEMRDANYDFQLGDWIFGVLDIGALTGDSSLSFYMIEGEIYSEGEKIEIFKRHVGAIDPMYIEDKILTKSANREIEKIEITYPLDDGGYVGYPSSILMPGQRYLINDGEKTRGLVCKLFPYFDENAGLFGSMAFGVAGNLKLLVNVGLLPDIYEDTKEDFVYVSGLWENDPHQVLNLCITTEPKTLTIKEVGYGNQFNYSAFEGKIGIDKEDGSSQKIDLKYLPEGIGHSQIEPKVSWRYSSVVEDYTFVQWNSLMYYIKIADNFDLVNNMTGIKTRNIFGVEQNIDISALNLCTVNNDLGETCQAYRAEGYDGYPIIYLVEDQFTIRNGNYGSGSFILTRGLWVWEDDNDDRHIIEIHSGEEEKIYPVPQKYIPALDSIILNGANGKQYSLTVDTNGQLSIKLI